MNESTYESLTCYHAISTMLLNLLLKEKNAVVKRVVSNRLIDIENRPVVAKGMRGRRGMEWEFGLADTNYYYYIIKLWINKVLWYSTGNHIQYLVINHNGNEYEKECKYAQLNHFAVQYKLAQLCKSTIRQ